MLRLLFCAVAAGAFVTGYLVADDTKKDKDAKDHKRAEATITKVDAKNGTVTVKMKDKSGKEVERKFKLTEDVVYFDSTGKVARLDIFQNGDDVLVLEEEGHLKEMKKAEHKDKTSASTDKDKHPDRK